MGSFNPSMLDDNAQKNLKNQLDLYGINDITNYDATAQLGSGVIIGKAPPRPNLHALQIAGGETIYYDDDGNIVK